jgi:hypothetical protein
MNYTRLSCADVTSALRDIATEAEETFGNLDGPQLNWRPDASRWSVAQCFEHLLTGNRLMYQAADAAMRNRPGLWQRAPILPSLFAQLLIRSQGPGGTRKHTAPREAQPTSSTIPDDVIQRFADQQRQLAEWVRTTDPRVVTRAIMVSPFVGIITYSVLDGFRLLVAHDRRHFEQARRVMQSGEFPVASSVTSTARRSGPSSPPDRAARRW